MNRLTRAKAIKEHCLECMGCDLRRAKLMGREPCGNGPVQSAQMVRECEDIFCSNYNYRTGRETTPGMKKKIVTDSIKLNLKKARSRQKTKQAQLHAQV